jgi:hypothetical protein
MTLGEPLDGLLEEGVLHLAYDLTGSVGGALVFGEFSKLRAALFSTQGPREAGGVRHGVSHVPHLIRSVAKTLAQNSGEGG